jgi:hypothetical protein
LNTDGQRLPTRCVTPVASGYRPDVDTSEELTAEGRQYFQQLIGVLRWAVEIGRLDIMVDVCMLSHHLALPRKGHLQQAFHIFGYLKAKGKRTLAFAPSQPPISETLFVQCDWYDIYPDAKENIPPDMPPPRGKPVSVHCFTDADHANDRVNRRSQTGVLIFVN